MCLFNKQYGSIVQVGIGPVVVQTAQMPSIKIVLKTSYMMKTTFTEIISVHLTAFKTLSGW